MIAPSGTVIAGIDSTMAIAMYSPASSVAPDTTDAAFSTALRTTAGAMSKTGKMIPGATRTDTLVDEEDDKERNMIKINRLLERRLVRKL